MMSGEHGFLDSPSLVFHGRPRPEVGQALARLLQHVQQSADVQLSAFRLRPASEDSLNTPAETDLSSSHRPLGKQTPSETLLLNSGSVLDWVSS